jgi:hypothetical protein
MPMSNPYINHLLFGHSRRIVDKEYIDALKPHMMTVEWIQASAAAAAEPLRKDSIYSQKNSVLLETPILLPEKAPVPTIPETTKPRHRQPHKNTLFWSIYSVENPAEAFLSPSAANVEIETRIKIVSTLNKTPKCMKDTNSKLTQDETQALFGAMLTAREDRVDFCAAYSVYYKKHILLVYPRTCRVFTPSSSATIEDDDDVIILRAAKDDLTQKTVYSAELNPTKEMAETILREKPTPLKAQSTYKNAELESIAVILNIPAKTPEGKRRKKEDLYNDIRVAIHNDMSSS